MFDDLYRNMYPIIKYDARKHLKATKKYGINFEDLESIFSEVVFEEAHKYKETMPFLQAYRARANQKMIDYIRYKTAKCRFPGKLSNIVAFNEELLEQQKDEVWMEDHVISRIETEKMLTDFVTKAHEHYRKVIFSLTEGYTNQEIAAALGDDQYSPRIRKTVQRARENFQKHYEAFMQAC